MVARLSASREGREEEARSMASARDEINMNFAATAEIEGAGGGLCRSAGASQAGLEFQETFLGQRPASAPSNERVDEIGTRGRP